MGNIFDPQGSKNIFDINNHPLRDFFAGPRSDEDEDDIDPDDKALKEDEGE